MKPIKKDKKKTEKQIIYGKQPVRELLRSGMAISKLYLARELDKRTFDYFARQAEYSGVHVERVEKQKMQRIAGAVVHQGICAEMAAFSYKSEQDLEAGLQIRENPFYLLLDQIQDPHNVGAIVRSAEIAGVSGLIIQDKGSADINATVAKTSAGAIFHLPIYRCRKIDEVIPVLQAANVRVVALAAGKSGSHFETDLTGPLAVVIGNEGQGIRKHIEIMCDATISIPQFGKVNSLNASVSAAIVIFEAVRQRLPSQQNDTGSST